VPEAWGHGIALEGGEMLLDHAFDDLGLAQVHGFCHPDNRSARAVLAALGFEPGARVRYDAGHALGHRIALNAWRALRNIPRGTRLRRALRAAAAGPVRSDPIEEPLHAHETDTGPPGRPPG